MDLNGQKCPACGRNFDHDDDIVVCPVCGTPQHRACWDERGECVNASRHAEGYVWQPEAAGYRAEPQPEEQTENKQGTQVCPICWKAGLIFMGLMLAVALPFTSKVEAFTTAYQAYSEAIYTSAPAADVATALETAATAVMPVLPMIGIQMVLHIVAGFIANPLYKRSVVAKVKKLRAEFPDDRAFEAATMRKGGTSILLAFTGYIGYYIVYNLLLYLVEMLIK